MLLLPSGNDLQRVPDRKRVPANWKIANGDPSLIKPGQFVEYAVAAGYEELGYRCFFTHFKTQRDGATVTEEPNYTAVPDPSSSD
jgi:hypothetical protein